MPHVPPSSYPPNLPKGAFHLDADHAFTYRLPRTLDEDYIIYFLNIQATESTAARIGWAAIEAPGFPEQQVTTEMQLEAVSLGKDRQIQQLQARIMTQAPAAPPIAAPRFKIALGTPTVFTGVRNEKGLYDPQPRDWTRNIRKYLMAQEQESGMTLAEHRKILIAATFLDKSATTWYEQESHKAGLLIDARNDDPSLPAYDGPFSTFDSFLAAILTQFEDVDFRKTAIHRIKTLKQEGRTAEDYVREFKEWAEGTGFDDGALVEWFQMGLKPALVSKVKGQGRSRPETLDGWIQDAMIFDRQWREDHPESHTSRSTSSTSSRAPAPPSSHSSLPRSPNFWPPRSNTSFRPWGAQAPSPSVPRSSSGVQPMDIDAVTQDTRMCYKCGKTGHISRFCRTPVDEIRRTYGRDSMYPPPSSAGRPMQNRATTFANAGEFVNSMTAEQRAELVQALQVGAVPSVSQPPPQDFANGSS